MNMNDSLYKEIIQETPEETKRLIHKQVDIAVQLEEYIKEKRTSKRDFAEMMGWQASYLSRVLAGGANLTLKTITKMEAVLQKDLIKTPMIYERQYEPDAEASTEAMTNQSFAITDIDVIIITVDRRQSWERSFPSSLRAVVREHVASSSQPTA